MTHFTHENRRKFTILTIVSVLVVAIITTTLILTLRRDTTAPTSTIEVGKRIDTRLGGGRTLLNASVWDGSSSTIWTNGTGTEDDPYLIESAANLAYLSNNISGVNPYSGKFFLQTVDIDLNNQYWTPISFKKSQTYYYFAGTYNGNGHKIVNLNLDSSSATASCGMGLFGEISGKLLNVCIDSVNITLNLVVSVYFGCLVGRTNYGTVSNCEVSNVNITGSMAGGVFGFLVGLTGGSVNDCRSYNNYLSLTGLLPTIGGLTGHQNGGSSINCVSKDIEIVLPEDSSSTSGATVGGVIGSLTTGTATNLYSNVDITWNRSASSTSSIEIGGVIGHRRSGLTQKCVYLGNIEVDLTNCSTIPTLEVGGIIGSGTFNSNSQSIEIIENMFDGTILISGNSFGHVSGIFARLTTASGVTGCTLTMNYNLAQGEILVEKYTNQKFYIGGIGGDISTYIDNNIVVSDNIVNCKINHSVADSEYTRGSGGVYGHVNTIFEISDDLNYFNSDITSFGFVTNNVGSRSSDEMKDVTNYSNWTSFADYWFINSVLNNGFPMLKYFASYTKVTTFDGEGSQENPFQIKTIEDLLGMSNLYNEIAITNEYFWILVNNLNISVDANNLAINWIPIGYDNSFNGHFNGDGKTISGLTITEQYENVGLFGRMSSNATITNLNVTGTINWDQATNVGGVVGLMEDGAKVTNCTFTGTITGYLNSGNYAIVGGLAGAYSLDAVTGSANYDAYVYGSNNYTTFNRYNTTYTVV